MSSGKVLELRSRDIKLDTNSSSDSDDQFSSVSENSDNDMPFDAKEAKEDIPELTGKNNFQQFLAICQEFKNDLGNDPDVVLVKIIKRKLKNVEAFTLCRNATTFNEIKEILSKKFGERATLNVLLSEMVNLQQKEHEDAKSYGDRALLLEEKIELVSEELIKQSTLADKNMSAMKYIYSKVIIEYFNNGLKHNDVKNIVKSNNLGDLGRAAEYAHSLESSFISNIIVNKQRNVYRNFSATRQASQPNFQSNMRNSNQNWNERNNVRQNTGNYRNTSGNRTFNAYKTNMNEPNYQDRNQIKKEIKSEPIHNINVTKTKCNFCGKVGHVESNCILKQRSRINILATKNEEGHVRNAPDRNDLLMLRKIGIS